MRTSAHRTITATALAVSLVALTGCSLLPGGEPAPSGTQSQAARAPGTNAQPAAAPTVSPVDPDAVVLEETLESVECRWCGAAGAVEVLDESVDTAPEG